jgi:hypothetical protein
LKQPQLELGLPESFEQIIKKYRWLSRPFSLI